MHDVLIVGGGPAGAVAGLVAARAGARVCIVDRAAFPRDKLCGDTVNPGALMLLRQLGVADAIESRGLRIGGMLVTGDRGVRVAGPYPDGQYGRSIVRRELDSVLVDAAVAAGCEFEDRVRVRRALVDAVRGSPRVTGVAVGSGREERTLRASVVLAADGRRSTLAFGLGLVRHPRQPRRWAIGGYFSGVSCRGLTGPGCAESAFGEMHVRRHCYVGVAPVPGGLTNVCVVRSGNIGGADFRDPLALLRRTIAADDVLCERLDGGQLAAPPVVLGPLAVDVLNGAVPGLLLAGDAAGFIDPMTGDGLRFAIQGGELAAVAALYALEHGWTGVHDRLARARSHAFARKWRFNRVLRSLVASPPAIAAAAAAARIAPALVRTIVARAGDCGLAA
jgi:flavin-dependent dehydrogenase